MWTRTMWTKEPRMKPRTAVLLPLLDAVFAAVPSLAAVHLVDFAAEGPIGRVVVQLVATAAQRRPCMRPSACSLVANFCPHRHRRRTKIRHVVLFTFGAKTAEKPPASKASEQRA